MPRRPHLIIAACVLFLGAPALAGCGFGAVEVEPYEPQPGSGTACTNLLDSLPDVVDDAVEREVSPDDLPAAAWGSPPIVLRCGVAMPGSYRPDAQLLDVDGVGWLADDGEGGTFFTSADREVLVEVAIPDDYAPEAQVLTDLAAPILEHLPERALP